jgi:hypothetical protein
MDSFERRKYTRTLNNFRTKIRFARTSEEVDGVTLDLSQGGAFVTSASWPDFQKNEQAEMRHEKYCSLDSLYTMIPTLEISPRNQIFSRRTGPLKQCPSSFLIQLTIQFTP